MPKYRNNKIKQEHTIIEGVQPTLDAMAECELIDGIIPARIKPVRRTADPLTYQYETESGLKLLAFNGMAVQEVFVITDQPAAVKTWLESQGLLPDVSTSPTAKPSRRKKSRSKPSRSKSDRDRRSYLPRHSQGTAGDHKNKPLDTQIKHALDDSLRQKLEALVDEDQKSADRAPDTPSRKKQRHKKSKKSRKPDDTCANPMEEWLEDQDEETWRQLLRKFKEDL